jgi:hypothetical protein
LSKVILKLAQAVFIPPEKAVLKLKEEKSQFFDSISFALCKVILSLFKKATTKASENPFERTSFWCFNAFFRELKCPDVYKIF